MTKAEALNGIQKFGTEAAFLGNVVLNWHSSPTMKLRGLLKLLQEGHDCRTGNEIDCLVIDGRIYGWEILESPVLVDRWASVAPKVQIARYHSEALGMVTIPEN